VLLTVVLAIMVGKTARTMQGVGWIPITPIDIDVPYWAGIWLGFFPTVETVLAQIGSVVFVIGSYMLAERLKGRPRGGGAPPTGTSGGNGDGNGRSPAPRLPMPGRPPRRPSRPRSPA
jgi:high-affinity iron transporter